MSAGHRLPNRHGSHRSLRHVRSPVRRDGIAARLQHAGRAVRWSWHEAAGPSTFGMPHPMSWVDTVRVINAAYEIRRRIGRRWGHAGVRWHGSSAATKATGGPFMLVTSRGSRSIEPSRTLRRFESSTSHKSKTAPDLGKCGQGPPILSVRLGPAESGCQRQSTGTWWERRSWLRRTCVPVRGIPSARRSAHRGARPGAAARAISSASYFRPYSRH